MTSASELSAPSFVRARSGYSRSSVDAFVRQVTERVRGLERERSGLVDEVRRLRQSLREAQARCQWLESATPEQRAQDILDEASARAAALVADAERQAREVLAQAEERSLVLDERARQEHAWHRRRLSRERTELAQQRMELRAQLSAFRVLATESAAHFPELRERISSVTRTEGAAGHWEQHP